MLPLEGITVVSLEQAVAAPFATRQLADLGARVIKVERENNGDFARNYDRSVRGMSSYFVWLNRGKESVVLNIKDPKDREILDAMLSKADVFVQGLVPGAMSRLGLDSANLTAEYPRLIYCSISGYGSKGSYQHKKAYDLLIQGEVGLMSITGAPDAPARVGISIADIATGMYAYSGVLTALYERERTGLGTSFEVAMLDALGEWVSQPYLYDYYGSTPLKRAGARHSSISPYGPYRTGDGKEILIGVQNEREWTIFCSNVLGKPELIDEPRFVDNPSRVKHDPELRTIVDSALARFTADEIEEQLDEFGIANSRMRTIEEFATHPAFDVRDRWRFVDSPVGSVRSMLPPVTATGREASMGAIPELGQHTQAIFAEFAPDGP